MGESARRLALSDRTSELPAGCPNAIPFAMLQRGCRENGQSLERHCRRGAPYTTVITFGGSVQGRCHVASRCHEQGRLGNSTNRVVLGRLVDSSRFKATTGDALGVLHDARIV